MADFKKKDALCKFAWGKNEVTKIDYFYHTKKKGKHKVRIYKQNFFFKQNQIWQFHK